MKIIILTLLAFLFTTSMALADWKESFLNDYTENGLNVALINALALGISPAKITDTAIAIDEIQAEMLVAAMCDAGVPWQDLQDSLPKLGIGRETAMIACNISAEDRFSAAGYSSARKKTDYDGGTASGHTFNP
jgi:lipid II:glycine glycyltransferase (peptidoglycan interpeptide bridge formation enzyme)